MKSKAMEEKMTFITELNSMKDEVFSDFPKFL